MDGDSAAQLAGVVHSAPRQCPKCHAVEGRDWSQCRGECPMPGSPHYTEQNAAKYSGGFPDILPNKHHVAIGMASVVAPAPTVGRIVHFYDYQQDNGVGGPYPAIVTAINEGVPPTIRIMAFIPTRGAIEIPEVSNDPGASCFWAWPPRD